MNFTFEVVSVGSLDVVIVATGVGLPRGFHCTIVLENFYTLSFLVTAAGIRGSRRWWGCLFCRVFRRVVVVRGWVSYRWGTRGIGGECITFPVSNVPEKESTRALQRYSMRDSTLG